MRIGDIVIFLPDAVKYIVVIYIHRISDKPFVVHVIKRFAILIDLSVYLFNFILVLGESEVDIPSEIFDFDGSGIQRYFDTIILHFR